MLIISVKHAGEFKSSKKIVKKQNQVKKLRHMRRKNSGKRRRSDIRLMVLIDGVKRIERGVPPQGPD